MIRFEFHLQNSNTITKKMNIWKIILSSVLPDFYLLCQQELEYVVSPARL